MSASPGRPKKRSRPLGGTARSARVPQCAIVIADTSVLLNKMDMPDRNQHKPAVLDRLGALIDAGDHLFIPMAAIVETTAWPRLQTNTSKRASRCTWKAA